MQNEKWGNIISDILEKIQENVNGKIDIVREMSSHSFVPVYISICSPTAGDD